MKRIFFLLLFCSVMTQVFPQGSGGGTQGYAGIQMPQLLPPSPEAYQLGTYGAVPVGLFTGSMITDVPLYEIKTRNLSVNLSLTYNSNGVKVDMPSSRVGTGWVLNAGGVITRTVYGKDDHSATRPPLPSSFTTPSNDLWNYLESLVATGDGQADQYSFNFNGYSGSFYITRSGEAVTFPYQPNFKILTSFGTEWNYQIITPDGVKYFFGGNNATERSKSQGGGSNCSHYNYPWVNNAWYLKRIEHPLGDNIYFKYNPVYYSHFASFSQSVERLYPTSQPNSVTPCQFNPQGAETLTAPENTTRSCYSTLTVDGLILHEIEFLNGSVRFLNQHRYDLPGDSCHSSMIVYRNGSLIPLKKILFDQTFAGTNAAFTNTIITPDGGTQRLFLDQVREVNPLTSTNLKVYTFEYEDRTALPPRLSMAQDHYGYFNGANNAWFVPANSEWENIFSGYGSNRAPNYPSSKKGLLKKIIYPTRGYTEIFYDQNVVQANKVTYLHEGESTVDGHFAVGGVRVAKIAAYDGVVATPVIKKYYYGQPGSLTTSSGSLMYQPQYISDMVIRKYCQPRLPEEPVDCGYYDWAVKSLNSNNLYPLYATPNNNVVYQYVTESEGENFENGGIVHKYMINFDAPAQVVNGRYIPSSPQSNFGMYNGFEVQTYSFAMNGSTVVKKKETVNQFKLLDEQIHSQAGIFTIDTGIVVSKIFFTPCTGTNMSAEDLAGYDINRYYTFSYFIFPEITTVYEYDQNGQNPLVKTTTREYSNLQNLQITKEKTYSSQNEELVNEFKYPIDFASSGNVYSKMISSNIKSPVIEQVNKKNGNTQYTVKTNYHDWFGDSKVLLPQTVDYSYKAQTPETRLRYHAYSCTGNALQVSMENDVPKSYVWGYNNQYPIAEVVNAGSTEIFYESFEEGTWWDSQLSAYDAGKSHAGKYSGRIDNPGSTEKVCQSTAWPTVSLGTPKKFTYSGWVYSNGPAAEIFLLMKRAGETQYSTYNDHITTTVTGQWVFLQKEYLVPADVVVLNIRIDNEGGGTVWFDDLRLHPSNAQMSTYTYDPLIGMTSRTDPNNKVHSYEYDEFGRLKLERDELGNILKTYQYNYKD
jgi:YD repeat-containing protein